MFGERKLEWLLNDFQSFVFSSVDHNTDYDDLEVLDRDEEEKYFDS